MFVHLMSSINVSFKMTLLWSLVVTLITSILYTFVFRLYVFTKSTLICKLRVTLITSILDTFMF